MIFFIVHFIKKTRTSSDPPPKSGPASGSRNNSPFFGIQGFDHLSGNAKKTCWAGEFWGIILKHSKIYIYIYILKVIWFAITTCNKDDGFDLSTSCLPKHLDENRRCWLWKIEGFVGGLQPSGCHNLHPFFWRHPRGSGSRTGRKLLMAYNHGDRFPPLRIGLWDPFQMAELHGLWMGVNY